MKEGDTYRDGLESCKAASDNTNRKDEVRCDYFPLNLLTRDFGASIERGLRCSCATTLVSYLVKSLNVHISNLLTKIKSTSPTTSPSPSPSQTSQHFASTKMATAITDKSPPSALAIAVSSLVLGLITGYFIGQGSSIGLFSSSTSSSKSKSKSKRKAQSKSWPNSYDVTIHPDSSADEAEPPGAEADDEDSDTDSSGEDVGAIADFEDNNDEVKLMFVVRTDLGMTKGKIAAQCGHATLACYKCLSTSGGASGEKMLKRWEGSGQPKIAVQCKSEEELQLLQAQAVSLGLCARVIHDAGRTQIAAGSATVLGVLGPKGVVDQVTGGLKLL